MASLAAHLHESTCPACGHHVAVTFFDGGRQPLATLGWPDSSGKARSMPRYPLFFVRCVDCGHVYNRDFRYQDVPYAGNCNLMFNHSKYWAQHLEAVRDLVLQNVPHPPVVVEIGCGTGELLSAMAEKCPEGRFIGFDPNRAVGSASSAIVARRELFDPAVHLPELEPHLVMSRHVLEHLTNPLGFVQRLSFAAAWSGRPTKLFLEVPCIDRAFAGTRTNDFYYEHNSHFTVTSFTRLLERCVSRVHLVETAYGREVVCGLVTVGEDARRVACARETLDFFEKASSKRTIVREQLRRLLATGKSVAIWGGSGKGAAFINYFGLEVGQFPLVVDSDPEKAGTFVPGTGQPIRFRDHLKQHPVDVILLTTQWRARDIVAEIEECGIAWETILVEHAGRLVDYFNDPNPYNPSPTRPDARSTAAGAVNAAGTG